MCLWYELTATLRQKKVASKLNFTEIPYKSIVALRFSGGYISLLGSILLGTSGHLVKPCETDPMQGSLLAVLAYGGLTLRLRFAYGRDSYSFGFSKGDLSYKWFWIRRWSLIILKIHLRQPYGCGTLCMTYVKPYGYLTNFRKKLTTGMNSSILEIKAGLLQCGLLQLIFKAWKSLEYPNFFLCGFDHHMDHMELMKCH